MPPKAISRTELQDHRNIVEEIKKLVEDQQVMKDALEKTAPLSNLETPMA